MKMLARDVRPAATPSIGTGKASANTAAASNASVPAIIGNPGLPLTKAYMAVPNRANPATLTGSATTGASRGQRHLARAGSLRCVDWARPGRNPPFMGCGTTLRNSSWRSLSSLVVRPTLAPTPTRRLTNRGAHLVCPASTLRMRTRLSLSLGSEDVEPPPGANGSRRRRLPSRRGTSTSTGCLARHVVHASLTTDPALVRGGDERCDQPKPAANLARLSASLACADDLEPRRRRGVRGPRASRSSAAGDRSGGGQPTARPGTPSVPRTNCRRRG